MASSLTPPPSPPAPAPHYRNLGTMVPGNTMLGAWQAKAKSRALAPNEAYSLAVSMDRTRERMAEIGYRLYWMSDKLVGSQDVIAKPSGYVVVGRHGCCDVVIDEERLVSLRHVLVRAAALDDGFPVLSLLDLQTSAGFELSDGSRQRSIASTGPVVFRIGNHSLVALPSSGNYPDVLPDAVVERAELPPHRIEAQAIALAPKPLEAGVSRPSRITVLPGSVDFSQRRSVPVEHRDPGTSAELTGEGYEVVLETRGKQAGVRLTKTDLEHGVLLGRADKCVDAGLRSVLCDTISRVHVLLIRENDACHLYDVASSVGTYVNRAYQRERIRFLPLDDAGTSVQLATHPGVILHWRAL